jgi:glycosyltransferase involved in cell wall biosynthesis
LSVVIPARDEEGCIASTVEHLHLELQLNGIHHEIIVVDDGSTDSTWMILHEESAKIPELKLEGFVYAPIIARPEQPTQQRGFRGGGQRGGGYGSGGPRHAQSGGGGGRGHGQGGRGQGGGRGDGGGQPRPSEGGWNRFGASGRGGSTGGGRGSR